MLTIEKRDSLDSLVDEMSKFLEFIEIVEQLNERYDYEEVGYAISYLILKANEKTCKC